MMPILGSIIKSAIEFRSKIPLEVTKKPSAIAQQRKTLKKLLRKAQFTSFGEQYGFQEIISDKDIISAFKKSVPVHGLNFFVKLKK